MSDAVASAAWGVVVLVMLLMPWLSWCDRLPRGSNPDHWRQRLYLMLPISLMFTILLVVVALDPRNLDAAGVAFSTALLLGAVGVLLFVFQPRRVRPRWQRRQIELAQARREQQRQGKERGHPYGVQVLIGARDLAPAGTAASVARAREHARERLAARGDAELALVVDLQRDAAIALVDRSDDCAPAR